MVKKQVNRKDSKTYPVIIPDICNDGSAKCTSWIHARSGVLDGRQVANGDSQSNSQRSNIFRIYCKSKQLAFTNVVPFLQMKNLSF